MADEGWWRMEMERKKKKKVEAQERDGERNLKDIYPFFGFLPWGRDAKDLHSCL